jgi:ATP-binding cassette subfamily F protein 3
VDDGAVTQFDGDLEDYARWLSTRVKATPPVAATPVAAAPREDAQMRRERKRLAAERRAALAPQRALVADLERQLTTMLHQRSQIEAQLCSSQISADRTRLVELALEQGRLSKRIGEIEGAWLEAAERLESDTAEQQGVD